MNSGSATLQGCGWLVEPVIVALTVSEAGHTPLFRQQHTQV